MSQLLHRIERDMNRRRRTPAQRLARNFTMTFLLVATPLLATELALRLSGFQRHQIDSSRQQQALKSAVDALNVRFNSDAFALDPWTLWKLRSGANLFGIPINERGLLSPPRYTNSNNPRASKPLNVLVIGDSVSAITYRTWPETAERLAAAGETVRPVRFFNASVPGYTTEQALRRFTQLKDLGPDIVIVCLGWNDQFPALNLPDVELGLSNDGTGIVHDLLSDIRLYQLAGAPLGAKSKPFTKEKDDAKEKANHRVGRRQFEDNLNTLTSLVRAVGATPVLATQPDNLDENSQNFLSETIYSGMESDRPKNLHQRYNEVIRKVAQETRTPLMDLEDEFMRRQRETMVAADGIHLTSRGHNHVARLVLALFRDEGIITQADYDAIARAERHDSSASDKPRAAWSIIPEYVDIPAGQPFSFSVVAQNAGNTRWLQQHRIGNFGKEKNFHYGTVEIAARWRTAGSPALDVATTKSLPSDILPGEATSVTLQAVAPSSPGDYELEIGLRAAAIGWLQDLGAESTTLTVTAR